MLLLLVLLLLLGAPPEEDETEKGEDMLGPAGSSLGVGTKNGVFGSSVSVVTVRSRFCWLARPFFFLF
jgi:hypothetical protein